MPQQQTAVLPLSSDLIRLKWMREGLIKASESSIFSPYTGTSDQSVIRQINQRSQTEGNTIVFDYDGYLTSSPRVGEEVATGTGENKRKFSNKVNIERYRWVVNNGDRFKAKMIGDLNITQHADSRAKLSNLFMRWKDQAFIDCLQGNFTNQAATHKIGFTDVKWEHIHEISTILKNGTGFTSGGTRAQIEPYITKGGEPFWVMLVDPTVSFKLTTAADYKDIMKAADVRGADNRLLTGVIGSIGNILVREIPQSFAPLATNASTWEIGDISVENPGLRIYDGSKWLGQEGYNFNASNHVHACPILGRNAVNFGTGKDPDYHFQYSRDFGIDSESALEWWGGISKVVLNAESEDYKMGKVAGNDKGTCLIEFTL